MGEQFRKLDAKLREFIGDQRVFFTASAAANARVNISPRGVEAFAVLDDKTAVYLDRTGSGNETAAHLKADGRLTIMFCAFEGPAKILRLYGRGEVLRRGSAAYGELLTSAFAGEEPIGAREMIRLHIDLVKTSCGWGMPVYTYRRGRPSLDNWAAFQGEEGLAAYRRDTNALSMDGLPTGLLEDS
jgi:Pyridoxamine 5'-phosphate oxidase